MDNTPKFTPGPWLTSSVIAVRDVVYVEVYVPGGKFWIAKVQVIQRPEGTPEANAHLIAEAPNLYEATYRCSVIFGNLATQLADKFPEASAFAADMVIFCDKALAKARGEK